MAIARLQTFNKDRAGNGGGVAIYVSDELKSFETTSPQLNNTDVEQVWCTILVGQEQLLLGCIYRPPPKPGEEASKRARLEQAALASIQEACESIKSKKFGGMCIAGDFNFNKTTWVDGVASTTGG